MNEVIKCRWDKISPSEDYVPNTLVCMRILILPVFLCLNDVPMQPGTFNIIPKLLPIEFSLVVEDKHQTPSKNNEIVSLNVECPTSLQQTARDTRKNLFLKLINDEKRKFIASGSRQFQIFPIWSGGHGRES